MNLVLSCKTITGPIYIGIFPSVGSFIFWNVSLRHINANQAGGLSKSDWAVFTAILSLLLGQPITFVQLLVGLLVFIGVYLTSKKKKEYPAALMKNL
ncbi:EamA family transporter [Peribacillus sp. NPDC006672]|uniref:EamA family transporter n=1 Tax=Peribacillus sp. NPDC006672 TaxID=3390606 RepID=UPI003CFCD1E9